MTFRGMSEAAHITVWGLLSLWPLALCESPPNLRPITNTDKENWRVLHMYFHYRRGLIQLFSLLLTSSHCNSASYGWITFAHLLMTTHSGKCKVSFLRKLKSLNKWPMINMCERFIRKKCFAFHSINHVSLLIFICTVKVKIWERMCFLCIPGYRAFKDDHVRFRHQPCRLIQNLQHGQLVVSQSPLQPAAWWFMSLRCK